MEHDYQDIPVDEDESSLLFEIKPVLMSGQTLGYQ